jgi:hypothetical protein
MSRSLLFVFVVLGTSTAARGQDMPLSQILIDGEGWKKVNNVGKPPQPFPGELAGTRDSKGRRATAYHGTADGGTLYVGYGDGRALWAFKMDKGQTPTAGAPYCPLRLNEGEGGIAVTSLTIDKDGRIYAATPIGIQVFDPTGRMCGVMAAPPYPVWVLTFEGDQLVAWMADGVKYTRRLKTAGVK